MKLRLQEKIKEANLKFEKDCANLKWDQPSQKPHSDSMWRIVKRKNWCKAWKWEKGWEKTRGEEKGKKFARNFDEEKLVWSLDSMWRIEEMKVSIHCKEWQRERRKENTWEGKGERGKKSYCKLNLNKIHDWLVNSNFSNLKEDIFTVI